MPLAHELVEVEILRSLGGNLPEEERADRVAAQDAVEQTSHPFWLRRPYKLALNRGKDELLVRDTAQSLFDGEGNLVSHGSVSRHRRRVAPNLLVAARNVFEVKVARDGAPLKTANSRGRRSRGGPRAWRGGPVLRGGAGPRSLSRWCAGGRRCCERRAWCACGTRAAGARHPTSKIGSAHVGTPVTNAH